jgi:hypothetical protein
MQGLRVSELWGGGAIRPIPSAGVPFVRPGLWITEASSLLTMFSGITAIGSIILLAKARAPRLHLVIAVLFFVLSIRFVFVAVSIGFTIAGV